MTDMVYTVAETAEILRTTKNYIYKLIRAGLIKTINLPTTKIRKRELERFLEVYEGYDLKEPEEPKMIDLSQI